jgi:glycosyltransferase 2 family protein
MTAGAGRGRAAGMRVLQVLLPPALIALLVWQLGSRPFERSVEVLRPLPLLAALLLGFVSTAAQAMRWRVVAAGYGQAAGLTEGHAVREYYRATFGNVVLPGGLLGDAARAWRNRSGATPSAAPGRTATAPASREGLAASAKAVLAERVTGTALLLAAGGLLTLTVDVRAGGLLLAGALVAGAVALPGLRRMTARARWSVVGWTLLAFCGLVGLFAVAAVSLGTARGPVEVVALGLVAMAGASMPFGIGGFGPREAVSAVAFGAAGLSADAGVATSAGFGLLAIVSTLPGAVLMLADLRSGLKGAPGSGGAGVVVDVPQRGEVELEADVRPEHEPSGRRP